MCGITGFYSKNSSTFDNAILKMNSAISHRGPDCSGFWSDKSSGIFFGHQRLSILDLSDLANQPMLSNSGRYIITYNGEIYNHLEIRKELAEICSTIKWKTTSDTETLLESLEFWGIEKTLKKINGMFAFGLWDKKNRSLTLVRDRIGEKPLYFGWQGFGSSKVFLFGSELKSLKKHPLFNKEINRNAIALLLSHNCIPDPHSIYKNIYKLLPGHYLQLNENDLKNSFSPIPKLYWSLTKSAINGKNDLLKLNETEICEDFEKNLKFSVKQRMISDVPLGSFLSGGTDSSVITALMQSQSISPIKTFSIGFEEDHYNEAKYSKNVAKFLGTDHTELYFSSKKALEIIPDLPTIYDEPFADNSQIPSVILSRLAKSKVKVALTGDGGDELFCGYNRYISTNKWSKGFDITPFWFRKFMAKIIKSMPNDKWNTMCGLIPGLNNYANIEQKKKCINALESEKFIDFYKVLTSHWQNPNDVVLNINDIKTKFDNLEEDLQKFENYQQMMLSDLKFYVPNDILVKVDRATMASSIESRAPFFDHKIMEYTWRMPQFYKLNNGKTKWILKKILNKYIPKNLINRPKKGFGIPLNDWLKGPLREWAENLLSEKKLLNEGYFDPKLVRTKWDSFMSNKNRSHYDLWNVLMFQSWIDKNN